MVEVYIWHVVIASVVLLNLFLALRTFLWVESIRRETALAHRLLLIWAELWGQPEPVIVAALKAELARRRR